MKNNKSWTFFYWHPGAWLVMLIFLPAVNYAQQQGKKEVKQGNESYENKNYKDAEKNYRDALKKNKNSYSASFNLGDAYYKQEKYDEAAQEFQALTHRATSKDSLAAAYHNLGNALLKSKKYQESAEAYKNALKNNPTDEDTRYNLAYAQQMLKQQQQQNKDKDKKDNKDKKDKDKKDKNKDDKQDKNNKDKDKQDQQNKEKQDKKKNKKEQPQPDQISKEDAQRLLDALQNDEKNIQNKVKKGKQGIKVKIEKDW